MRAVPRWGGARPGAGRKPGPKPAVRHTSRQHFEKLPAHGSLTRPNMVAVGTIVWLSSELMFFAALFAMYFTIR